MKTIVEYSYNTLKKSANFMTKERFNLGSEENQTSTPISLTDIVIGASIIGLTAAALATDNNYKTKEEQPKIQQYQSEMKPLTAQTYVYK